MGKRYCWYKHEGCSCDLPEPSKWMIAKYKKNCDAHRAKDKTLECIFCDKRAFYYPE